MVTCSAGTLLLPVLSYCTLCVFGAFLDTNSVWGQDCTISHGCKCNFVYKLLVYIALTICSRIKKMHYTVCIQLLCLVLQWNWNKLDFINNTIRYHQQYWEWDGCLNIPWERSQKYSLEILCTLKYFLCKLLIWKPFMGSEKHFWPLSFVYMNS